MAIFIIGDSRKGYTFASRKVNYYQIFKLKEIYETTECDKNKSHLLDTERKKNGVVWLRYKVLPNGQEGKDESDGESKKERKYKIRITDEV